MMRLAIAIGVVILVVGCGLVPEVSHQPTLHNPFPQLTKVAVAPFFNLTTDATVDGRQFGLAYYAELQLVPGFEVVPIGVVENKIREYNLTLNNPADVRRLAQLLEVDAVVLGAVTDFSAYYPPRCGLQVEWYTANPCFHPIPPGYGLPWGTPEEEDIPQSLVMETEMALAREQLKTQTPPFTKESLPSLPAQQDSGPHGSVMLAATASLVDSHRGNRDTMYGDAASAGKATAAGNSFAEGNAVRTTAVDQPDPMPTSGAQHPASAMVGSPGAESDGLPANWPDPRGLVPAPPSAECPQCHPSDEPVLRHTRTYHGNDPQFTAALQNYFAFRDEARFGGWQSYLQRSDDFIRFCCHMHIAEMLTARGGAGETRVVWHWSECRY